MPDRWVVTWEHTAFAPVGGRNLPPRRQQQAFNSLREAVNFAMSLDDAQRSTVQIHLPGGEIVYLASIEGMHTGYQKEDKGAKP
jgi:hypothetical protein